MCNFAITICVFIIVIIFVKFCGWMVKLFSIPLPLIVVVVRDDKYSHELTMKGRFKNKLIKIRINSKK